ncbi:MAG TPA: hypothetical protein VKQ09_05870 [Sphingomonas sp.]|nr:hypothetical protein [Sphingomonas sp.]
MLETLGASLARIKKEDNLTDVDLGRVLGKSDDQAGKYRSGDADMGVVSLLLGCREWDGRFINDALGLFGMKVVSIESSAATDRDTLTALTGILNEVAIALADDGKIDDRELMAMRPELDAAGRVIDALRERLRLRCVA